MIDYTLLPSLKNSMRENELNEEGVLSHVQKMSDALGAPCTDMLIFLVKQKFANKKLTETSLGEHLSDSWRRNDRTQEQWKSRGKNIVSELRKKLQDEDSHGDLVFTIDPRGYNVTWTLRSISQSNNTKLDSSDLAETLSQCGLVSAFRIPVQNLDRQRRVNELIREEIDTGQPRFWLVASSGFSYVNLRGSVWQSGLGEAVKSHNAQLDVVIESPFSDFAETRALANGLTAHHWDDGKVDRDFLHGLLAEYPGVSMRVTDIPVNCSLFFTTRSVFYDPYLWARPNKLERNENNFWVFEFRNDGPPGHQCYELLRKHFDFARENSVTFEEFLNAGPSFHSRTREFESRMRLRNEAFEKRRSSGGGSM